MGSSVSGLNVGSADRGSVVGWILGTEESSVLGDGCAEIEGGAVNV